MLEKLSTAVKLTCRRDRKIQKSACSKISRVRGSASGRIGQRFGATGHGAFLLERHGERMTSITNGLLISAMICTACATGRGAGPDGPDPKPDLTGAEAGIIDLLTRRVVATNSQDWEAWQSLHTENCIRTAPDLKVPLKSSAEMRAAIGRLGKAFPNYHVALIRVVGTGPWFAAEFRSSGTMTHALEVPGSLIDIPAQNRHFRQNWMAFIRVENGRIAEFHERYDQANLVDQITGKGEPHVWEN